MLCLADTIPLLPLPQTMFVLPCSGDKDKSSSATTSHGGSVTDSLPQEIARELLRQRARNRETSGIDESNLTRAIDRYNGPLYQIARRAITKLIREGARVLIVSGGYGVVLPTEPIGDYNSEFKLSMWQDIVQRCLAAYAEEMPITTVVGVMSQTTDYAKAFRKTEWPSNLSQVLLGTPEPVPGAMKKAPKAQGEALVEIARSGELVKGWRSSDGLAMQVEWIETR